MFTAKTTLDVQIRVYFDALMMKKNRIQIALFAALLSTGFIYAQPESLEIVDTLAASVEKGVSDSAEPQAYLMSYFKDETHSLYFAVSLDGYSFTDVNDGNPVLQGKDLAEQKGVRDPHITRGPDGAFYLSMTDLHIFAQREGLRDTEWERPGERYSWGNNRALILMKSYDLIHWTHSIVHVGELFPEYSDIGCAWAPQTIYDANEGRMMVYFTTRIGNGPNFMVYSYADDAFTTLQTQPVQVLHYPRPEVNTIDADIMKVGDTYHMFYVAHEPPGGIRHATSSSINQDYQYEAARVDSGVAACEAPNLWYRKQSSSYVLMYDIFGLKPNNMGFSETTDFVHYTDIGRFNDGDSPMKATNFSGPKHGSVMMITLEEREQLMRYFSEKTQ